MAQFIVCITELLEHQVLFPSLVLSLRVIKFVQQQLNRSKIKQVIITDIS